MTPGISPTLLKAAAETLITITADPKHLGARIGLTAVLHSWGSALTHHPHVHIIVPGGGISFDGQRWISCSLSSKIGGAPLAQDLKRIDAAARLLDGPDHLAVDAIYAYTPTSSIEAADALAPLGLWWFEDICDPLDFETLAAVARCYTAPIAAGEALFSAAEANLLDRHGGLRRDRDILLFDPVHCYGLPGYLQIVEVLEKRGWPRAAFWPHGGHLFCLHVVAALGLGGAEVNPLCFQPFGGYGDNTIISEGVATPSQIPGIGFEARQDLRDLLATLLDV
jgi:L-alanine-DL-glutamate epimerase-like enolase superfamily enzyme